MQLDQLMKLLGWVESGAMAHEVIDQGLVKVDGETELRRRRKLREGMIVEFINYRIKIEL
ncbi:MAG TPA: RNA-binding S4 domain-containing protein [Bacteroidales bacterium]|nr:RNA-binding S4 domain-containing protein [Bacteroidales bacterium]